VELRDVDSSRRGPGSWVSKAKCHLSPALSASQQGTGREGGGLAHLVVEPWRLRGVLAHGHYLGTGRRRCALGLEGAKMIWLSSDLFGSIRIFLVCFFVCLRTATGGRMDGHGLTRTGRCLRPSRVQDGLRCAWVWARRTGFPSLVSQLPGRDVRCAKSNLSLPFGEGFRIALHRRASVCIGVHRFFWVCLFSCFQTGHERTRTDTDMEDACGLATLRSGLGSTDWLPKPCQSVAHKRRSLREKQSLPRSRLINTRGGANTRKEA
jgi:hypothetical protein